MGLYEDLEILVDISRLPSLTQVALKRGVAKSAISRRLAALEDRVGGLLVVRSSHNVSLTELGEDYLALALSMMDQVETLAAQQHAQGGALRGKLRMSVPQDFGQAFLVNALEAFQQMHPELTLHIDFDNRIVDMISEKYDLAIRIGNLPDSQLYARRFHTVSHVLCAAPNYLESYGTPKDLADLKHHKMLHYGSEQQFKLSVMERNTPKDIMLRAAGSSNNGLYLRQLVENGQGIIKIPNFLVDEALAQGRLRRVLPQYSMPDIGLYALFPTTKYMPPAVRAMVDFLNEKCQTYHAQSIGA